MFAGFSLMEKGMARQDSWNNVTYRAFGDDANITLLDAVLRKHRYSLHSHAELVVAATVAGSGRYSVAGRREVAYPGQLLTFNPEQPHAGETVPNEAWHHRAIYFDVPTLSELLESRLGIRTSIALSANSSTDPLLARGFLVAFDRLSGPLTDTSGEEVLLDFLRLLYAKLGCDVPEKRSKASCDENRLRIVVEYVRANFTTDIRLREMALLAKCEDYHLIRLFRQAIGFTPHGYIVQLRLNEARRLLRYTQLSCAEIAADVGFCDQGHLIRQFKRAYAITPSQYRAAFDIGRKVSTGVALAEMNPLAAPR
jgi:AraC-like DNA-binding protein/quercetin dioxygenase-like cupin family protein